MADGKVTISTALDNTGIAKGIKDLKGTLRGIGSAVKGTLGGLAKVAAGMTATITAAFGAAAVAITKQATDAYADYEQLIGGVETLFKDGADKVAAYAEDAFYRAGVSANKYMETVTSFSASLINSLSGDTAKAADVADMAMVDMADNANKMGTAVESIQNAYQGFAKQQYQLLDNLKLGYNGTKTEMERLLKDAEAYSGVKYDIDNLADVYSAIHAIQEKLGIAGTTAKEAEKTISGSAAMTKAAWENVLAAISGGGDLDKAINNLVFSISKYFENIVPVVQRSLAGIGRLIEQVAPQLVQTVATALIQAIPSLLSAVYQMIIGLGKGIYQGIVALFSQNSVGKITAQIGEDASGSLGDVSAALDEVTAGFEDAADAAKEAKNATDRYLAGFDEIQKIGGKDKGSDAVGDISLGGISVSAVSVEGTEELAEEAQVASRSIADMVGDIINTLESFDIGAKVAAVVNEVATAIRDTMVSIDFFSVAQWVGNALSGIVANVDWSTVGQIVAETLTSLADIALGTILGIDWGEVTQALSDGLVSCMDSLAQWLQDVDWAALGDQLFTALIDMLAGIDWAGIARSFGTLLGSAILGFGEFVWGAIDDAVASIDKYFTEKIVAAGGDIIQGLFDGIVDGLASIGQWIVDNIFTPFIEGFKSVFGIHSPSTIMAEQGGFLIAGLLEGIVAAWEAIKTFFSNACSGLMELLTAFGSNVKTWASGVWNGIKAVWDAVATWFDQTVIQPVAEAFTSFWDGLVGFASDAWEGIQDVFGSVAKFFKDIFTEAWEGVVSVFSTAGDIFNDIVGGVTEFFKGVVNGLIDGINKVVALPFNGINSALKFVRDINILGLEPFSGLSLIDVPQIPHLAQGAVLPANQPFLAVVGDQKHGTNVEAPLETIQEAVALVMADMLPAMVAGFEAVVAEQQATRRAVEGIELGDTTIGQAAARYSSKMAIIRGGM